jgi:hypothetical protein
MYYRQCRLEKPGEFFTSYTVSYIPDKYAKVGNKLNLKIDGIWSYGWIVKTACDKVHEDFLPDSHSAIKNHRKATGDSLPKK